MLASVFTPLAASAIERVIVPRRRRPRMHLEGLPQVHGAAYIIFLCFFHLQFFCLGPWRCFSGTGSTRTGTLMVCFGVLFYRRRRDRVAATPPRRRCPGTCPGPRDSSMIAVDACRAPRPKYEIASRCLRRPRLRGPAADVAVVASGGEETPRSQIRHA